MLRQDITILSTSSTGDSGWTDVSTFEDWSMFVDALESSSRIDVYACNAATPPPDATTGTFLVGTINTAPGFIGNDSLKDSNSNVVVAHYILAKKTAGGSPAATNVQMFARSFEL